MYHLKIEYNSEVIKQNTSKCYVAISYIIYKWQPSLNKNHAHGNDVRQVKKKAKLHTLRKRGVNCARNF